MPTVNGFPVLDDRLAFGFQSDPQFLTTGPVMPDGSRPTTPLRTTPVMTFSFTFNNQNIVDVRQIRHMFYDVKGGDGNFVMKDAIEPGVFNEPIGTGDAVETQFQLTRQLGRENPITKTVEHIDKPTLVVYLNNVVTNTYTEALGLLTFSPAPGSGVKISYDADVYYKVKFDNDRFPARRVASPNAVGKIENLTATEQL